jgi:hypothetical protein
LLNTEQFFLMTRAVALVLYLAGVVVYLLAVDVQFPAFNLDVPPSFISLMRNGEKPVFAFKKTGGRLQLNNQLFSLLVTLRRAQREVGSCQF